MAFRINNNIQAFSTWRLLSNNQNSWTKSMQRLSSGLRINSAADDPAGLVISMTMRAQMAGIGQAIENSEMAISMLQPAESGLNEVHNQLLNLREIALSAANEGVHSPEGLAVMQGQIDAALDSINLISANTQFSGSNLLDGSAGLQGVVTAGDISYLGAGSATASGVYDVIVDTQATQATHTTGNSGAIAGITADETLTITNSATGESVDVNLSAGDDAQTIVDQINTAAAGLGLTASTDGTDITLTSTAYGAAGDFTVISDNAAADGSQSGFSGGAGDSGAGVDIEGHFTLNGIDYQANGSGATLTGVTGSGAEGLQVMTDAAAGNAGTVSVTNNSLVFQIGPNAGQSVSIALDDFSSGALGRGLDGLGGGNQFGSLAEIDVTNPAAVTDALEVIDAAIAEVSAARGRIGAFQSNTLESGINSLHVAYENMAAAESIIRDTDFAAEMLNFSRSEIMLQSSIAMLSHSTLGHELIIELLRT